MTITQIVTRQVNGIAIVDISASFAAVARTDERRWRLREVVTELLARGQSKIVFNLSQDQRIGHCALGELIWSFKTIRDHHGQLKLSNVQPRVRGELEYTHLLKIFDIHPDEASAIQSFTTA